MPTCSKCDKFLKKGYTRIKTHKFGINHQDKNWKVGLPAPEHWFDEISYECKGGCDNGAGGVWNDEPEEQPSSPDDGTAENEEPQVEEYKWTEEEKHKIGRFLVITNTMDYLKSMLTNPDIDKYHIDAIDLCAKALMELKPK